MQMIIGFFSHLWALLKRIYHAATSIHLKQNGKILRGCDTQHNNGDVVMLFDAAGKGIDPGDDLR